MEDRTEKKDLTRPVEVTVMVLTYNPIWEKLIRTIKSILMQRGIDLQIVVSDDGSRQDYFKQLALYFEKHHFERYHLVKSEKNQGTVLNILSGMEKATGEYVKLISPGDFLCGAEILMEWVNDIRSKCADLSFGKVIYYREENGIGKPIRHKASPQMIKDYVSGKDREIRYDYLLLNDTIHGVSVVCKKNLLKAYLEEAKGKVIYAEDALIRLMIYDGHKICFFNENVVFYEYGAGISTVKSEIWMERIQKDVKAVDEMLFNRESNKAGKALITDSIKIRESESRLQECRILLKYPKILLKRVLIKFHKSYTEVEWKNETKDFLDAVF